LPVHEGGLCLVARYHGVQGEVVSHPLRVKGGG
jgi:hypothetical protein